VVKPPEASAASEPGESRSPFATAGDIAGDRPKFPSPGRLQNGFETIISNLFDDGFDPEAEFQEITAGLEITGSLTPVTMREAANVSEGLADRGMRLYIVAKREVSAYMRETDAIVGAIRQAATEVLETEKRTVVLDTEGKKKPLRTKMITDKDVDGECARLYPDEWSEVTDRREKADLMLRQIENLKELSKQRGWTIGKMLGGDR
jgi:hypothetical protein